MKILPVCPYSFGANTYIVYSSQDAYIIDPSTSVTSIKRACDSIGVKIQGVLLTHGHFDHTISLDTLRSDISIPAYIHEKDAEMLTDGRKNAYFDFFGKESSYSPAEHTLVDGQKIPLGNEFITVIHTPGHTAGSVCYHCGNFLVTGDTLFSNSIVRCDL